jgi:hypothetical protein
VATVMATAARRHAAMMRMERAAQNLSERFPGVVLGQAVVSRRRYPDVYEAELCERISDFMESLVNVTTKKAKQNP